jgi:hypothetical protein
MVACDDISQPLGTEERILNVSDLAYMIVLYVNKNASNGAPGIAVESLLDTLKESEWSWLVRDVYVRDHSGLHEAISIDLCNHRLKIAYNSSEVVEVIKIRKGGSHG